MKPFLLTLFLLLSAPFVFAQEEAEKPAVEKPAEAPADDAKEAPKDDAEESPKEDAPKEDAPKEDAKDKPAEDGDVTNITIDCDKFSMIYKTTVFSVKAGTKVKLTLLNPVGSILPHNIVIVAPGKAMDVGLASNAGLADPKFILNPVPKSEHILHASKLVNAGQQDVLEFTAPKEAGDYPYLCTYPGHWALMKGVMKVTE